MAQFDERAFWMAVRQALLMQVDAIEIRLAMPRTSEMRKQIKSGDIMRRDENGDLIVVLER